MYTEDQVLAQSRRTLLGALLFVTLLGAAATVLLANPMPGLRYAIPLVPAIMIPILAAMAQPWQRMRRDAPDHVALLRNDEWRALGITRATRNALVATMAALPLLAFALTAAALPNSVAVLAAAGCTVAAAAFLLTVLWHDRG